MSTHYQHKVEKLLTETNSILGGTNQVQHEDVATETTLSEVNTKLGGVLQVELSDHNLATSDQTSDMYEMMTGANPEDKLQVQSNGESLATESTLQNIDDTLLNGVIQIQSNGLDLATSEQIADMYDMMTGANLEDKLQVQSNGESIASETTLTNIGTDISSLGTEMSNANSKLTDIDTRLTGDLNVISNSLYLASENTLSGMSSTLNEVESKIDTSNTKLDAIDTKLAGSLNTTVPNMLVAHCANLNNTAQYVINTPCQLHGIFMSAGTSSFHGIYALYDATSGITNSSATVAIFGIKGRSQHYIQFPGPIVFSQGIATRGIRGEDPTSTTSADGSNFVTFFYTV